MDRGRRRTLADLLTAVLVPGLVLERVVEGGPGTLPELLGLGLRRG